MIATWHPGAVPTVGLRGAHGVKSGKPGRFMRPGMTHLNSRKPASRGASGEVTYNGVRAVRLPDLADALVEFHAKVASPARPSSTTSGVTE